MKLPQFIATATTAAVLATAGVSIAGATSDGGSSVPASPTANASNEGDPNATSGRAQHRLHRRHRVGRALEVAAGTIGIDRADLVQQLRDGTTVAEIATANGVEPQAVIDALVEAGKAKIADAVAAGKLTEEQAAKLTERLPERAGRLVNNEHSKETRQERREARRERRRAGLELAAQTIGIEPADLGQQLRDRKTLAEVATANGVDPQTVINALVDAANTNIQAAKDAGKLTEEQAAKLAEKAPERITRLVNEGRRQPGTPGG